ncbi:S-adenosylmethionine:tRNA ribosyltransferase-isomerase [Rosistilla oblonga]|uniref:tRNA preQ1(34) S-adenosylmethionine ribosyltransferase-isomerase QueA n=1 Tax=Rosistilla oblonga TaxID=2527990 RepID=UPI00118B6213|nr:tRNA preQ1(34) S-adenosylmethionine ribosyltransferase-isomerase QueA [Rosistilla oblonga]QDV10817.1 S-adenosylmethionine:tRNA ribosyltransferase-isomerase [Rosistilla oblonga]
MSELDLYDYQLPRELIAQHPLSQRADARLMVVDRRSGSIEHHYVRDLPSLVEPNDVMVFNDSRVIPARLVGLRSQTGGRWQGLFVRKDNETGLWEILSRTRGKLKVGEQITLEDRDARPVETLEVIARLPDGHLAVRPGSDGEPAELLERFGRVPLPPYIREGQMVDDDVKTYQTVFARDPGSIAAPTAGLHFTPELLKQLQAKGVQSHAVTLHVGIGTFRPVQTETLDEHEMHYEWASISAETAEKLNAARAAGGRVLAVGTTSVRTLETVAAENDQLVGWTGMTNLFVRPPYKFGAVDRMLTNFHLPKSTLLMLVSAFAGRELIMEAYAAAIAEEYRFFSYGDAMLII